MGVDEKCVQNFNVKLEQKGNLEDLGKDWRIILDWKLKK